MLGVNAGQFFCYIQPIYSQTLSWAWGRVMEDLRFGVYEQKLVYDADKLIRRQLIVLKDQDGDIVGWTDFHKYARSGKKSLSRSIYSGQDRRCIYAALLLNYVFFDKYHITKLTDITVEMVRCFLTDLQNKSELEKQYERVSDEVFNYSLWKASKVIRE